MSACPIEASQRSGLCNGGKSKNPRGGGCWDREKLRALGEGQMITVVAWALAARAGGSESCNCYLGEPKDTDNHIVLVDPNLKRPTLKMNEGHSVTAEFTPRVRLKHRNFTQEKLQSLIDPTWKPGQTPKKGKLLVRETGRLMFDSEHYCGPFPLKRERLGNSSSIQNGILPGRKEM